MTRLASGVMTRAEKVGVDVTVTVDGAVDEWGNPRLRVRVGEVGPLDGAAHGRLSDTQSRGYSRFCPSGRHPGAEPDTRQPVSGATVFAIVRLDDLGAEEWADGGLSVTVTELLPTEGDALAEAARLNVLAAGRGSLYVVRAARLS